MSANVAVHLVEGPLMPQPPAAAGGAGAVVQFEGVVRPEEEGKPLAALVYEAYEPMTTRELTNLAETIAAEHGLLAIAVEHSVGRIAAGETSFRLTVSSRHRAEALAAMERFIVEMKRVVPLWKVARFSDVGS